VLRALSPLLLCLLLGCATEPEAPEAAGERCDTHEDCARTGAAAMRRCGRFPICVAGRCELSATDPGGGSRFIVCEPRDAGERDAGENERD
jgi:hypothetical protein